MAARPPISFTIGELSMWPFKKKESTLGKTIDRSMDRILEIRLARIDELKSFRKAGEKFNYLGATIICTGYFDRGSPTVGLLGDYRNEAGEIKNIFFSYI